MEAVSKKLPKVTQKPSKEKQKQTADSTKVKRHKNEEKTSINLKLADRLRIDNGSIKQTEEASNILPHLVIDSEDLSEFSRTELLQKIQDRLLTPLTIIKLPNGHQRPFLIYLLELDPVPQVQATLDKLFEINNRALAKIPSVYIEEILVSSNLKFFPVLINGGLAELLKETTLRKVALRLLLTANISRLLFYNQEEIFSTEILLQVIHTPDLISGLLNYLYRQVGELCRRYLLKHDHSCLNEIIALERKYITVFRFIRSNGVELTELCNVGECFQAVMNTYLYHLIKYFIEHTNENDYVNVVFYHYSNFPIANKVIMSPVYNDNNFLRIQELLREKLFIKRIVKKKLGKRTFRVKNGEHLQIPEVEISIQEEEIPTDST